LGHGAWSQDEWRRWGLSDWRTTDVTLDALVTYGGQPDLMVHCAGGASVTQSMAYPYQDFQRTVATTAAVLEYARLHAKSARVVLVSSAGVYGDMGPDPIPESATPNPVSPYGMHKKMSEDLCLAFGRSAGVASVVVRLFSVYGPGLRKQLLWDACRMVADGDVQFFGTGHELRDWLHVEDAARLLALAAEHAARTRPVVNGGTGIGTSTAEVLAAVFKAHGRSDTPRFTGITRQGDPPSLIADMSHAAELGWQPRVGWREGVAEYVNWFIGGQP
jgi:UDP-glucose 4-epimerase